MISGRRVPPFMRQSPGATLRDAAGRIKAMIRQESRRSFEVGIATQSWGCDGKQNISFLRGLDCETSGNPTVAANKDGMPIPLAAGLPRGVGSYIRGAGGALVVGEAAAAWPAVENVLYDNFGNCWSLDRETETDVPMYLGETPLDSFGGSPVLCVQDPQLRPHEQRFEYINSGGDPPELNVVSRYWRTGVWSDFESSPWVYYTNATPETSNAGMRYLPQWLDPAEGTEVLADTLRIITATWGYPEINTPEDFKAVTENDVDEVVAKYMFVAPDGAEIWTADVTLNRFSRPLIEHISTGARAEEANLVICLEREATGGSPGNYIVLRRRGGGALTLIDEILTADPTDLLYAFTPDKNEGWIYHTCTPTTVGDNQVITLERFRSRATYGVSDPYGRVLNRWNYTTEIRLPTTGYAHDWTSGEPVLFRAGVVRRSGLTGEYLTPRLPRWNRT